MNLKRRDLWIAIALLILPALLRALWFYQGFTPRREIPTPEYDRFGLPQAPVSSRVEAEPTMRAGSIVVVDYEHGNNFQKSEIQALIDALGSRGARVEFADGSPPLEVHLKYASAYAVIVPISGFASDEIRAVRAFIQRGGRLLVMTDATRGMLEIDFFTGQIRVAPDVDIANPLLAPFGITVHNDYLYNLVENEGNFRNVLFRQFGKHDLTSGLAEVALYGSHSVSTGSGTPLLIGDEYTYTSLTDSGGTLSAAAVSRDGNVLVFGDFSFLNTPYHQVGDNGILISNIADFLLGGKRTLALADFPYVFSRPIVQVLPTADVQLTSELLDSLANLQFTLSTLNVELQLAEETPEEGDVLVLGTFSDSEDLLAYLEPFEVFPDYYSEYIDIPGFGRIGRYGTGVMLFQPGRDGNTLILLADTNDDLISLLDMVSSGELGGCVLQANVGVCSIGSGGGFSEEEPTPSEEPADTSAGDLTPTPEVTPTPSG